MDGKDVEYYSAIKRNRIGSFEVMWMNLEAIVQSEVSHKEKISANLEMIQMNLFEKQK